MENWKYLIHVNIMRQFISKIINRLIIQRSALGNYFNLQYLVRAKVSAVFF